MCPENHLGLAVALNAAGVDMESYQTWTADGLPVRGVRFPDGRFVVVI